MAADEHLEELAAGYALGALEPEEVAWVESRLVSDPVLRAAIDEARAAIELLPLAAPTLTPPTRLRDSLMLRLAPAAVAPRPAPRAWRRWWQPAFVAAAACLLLFLGYSTLTTNQELQAGRAEIERLAPRATVAAMVVSAVTSPRATAVPLRQPTPQASGEAQMVATQAPATGRLLVDPQAGRVMGLFQQLPPLPQQQVYQVWLMNAGEPRTSSIGRIRLDDDGSGFLVAPMPAQMERARELWVTIEPSEGSTNPSAPPVLAASL